VGKIILYGFFYVCGKIHGKIIIKCNILRPFGGIAKM
jgi:hypothetical protein